MTAVTLERPTAQLPDAGALSERQLLGIDCAWCGAYLGIHAERLGAIRDRGYSLQLFGCARDCGAPPWRDTPLGRLPRWTAAGSMPDPLGDDYDDDPVTVRRVAARLRALADTAPHAPP